MDCCLIVVEKNVDVDAFRLVHKVIAPDVGIVFELCGDFFPQIGEMFGGYHRSISRFPCAPAVCRTVPDAPACDSVFIKDAVDGAFAIVVHVEKYPHAKAFGFSDDIGQSLDVALFGIIIQLASDFMLHSGCAEWNAKQTHTLGFEIIKILEARVHVVVAESAGIVAAGGRSEIHAEICFVCRRQDTGCGILNWSACFCFVWLGDIVVFECGAAICHDVVDIDVLCRISADFEAYHIHAAQVDHAPGIVQTETERSPFAVPDREQGALSHFVVLVVEPYLYACLFAGDVESTFLIYIHVDVVGFGKIHVFACAMDFEGEKIPVGELERAVAVDDFDEFLFLFAVLSPVAGACYASFGLIARAFILFAENGCHFFRDNVKRRNCRGVGSYACIGIRVDCGATALIGVEIIDVECAAFTALAAAAEAYHIDVPGPCRQWYVD